MHAGKQYASVACETPVQKNVEFIHFCWLACWRDSLQLVSLTLLVTAVTQCPASCHSHGLGIVHWGIVLLITTYACPSGQFIPWGHP